MDDLRDLYQTTILDHNKSPRNFGKLEGATHQAQGHNPLCGDEVEVTLLVDDGGRIQDVRFEGQGCSISTSSASIMTGVIKGKTVEEAKQLFASMHALLTEEDEQDLEALGKLAVFSGVRGFPMRVKCATLAWHTLKNALEHEDATAKTE